MGRKELRKATVGAKVEFQKEIKTINGEEFEVRQPTVSTRGKLMQKSRDKEKTKNAAQGKEPEDLDSEDILSSLNYGKLQAYATIYCTFVPGTDEKVFDETDFRALLEQPTGSFVDVLGNTAMQLMNVKPEEDAKN